VTSLTRSLLTVTACAAALIVLVTGCGGATTSVAGAALSSTGASASTPPAGQAASQAPARLVYLAEGGSVAGTAARAPACGAGCQLSGDGTTSLWDMTWPTWNSAVAAGTGTEKLDDCTPNCAAGTLHAVRVAVTLSRPVMVCVAGTGKWFWTRVSFTWPDGLPAAFSGGNAPLNPFDYQDITSQSAKSCP
jgi:hypothetical protein